MINHALLGELRGLLSSKEPAALRVQLVSRNRVASVSAHHVVCVGLLNTASPVVLIPHIAHIGTDDESVFSCIRRETISHPGSVAKYLTLAKLQG